VKAEKRRQTAGPTLEDVRRLLAATNGDTEAETRDYAIVLTFYCLWLRVSELCGLNSTIPISRGQHVDQREGP
jgi:site-specific recombinase XerC